MIATTAKTQRRTLLQHVDTMQRRIVAVHRIYLNGLLSFASRHVLHSGGRVYLDPHEIRHRLDVLLHQTIIIMRPTMATLVVDGGKAGRAVLEAGLRSHIKTRR